MNALTQRLVGWFAGYPRDKSAAVPVRAAAYGRAGAPSRVQGFDQALLWVTVALLAFGLVMVYSASVAMPDNPKFARYSHDHFLVRHAAFIVLGKLPHSQGQLKFWLDRVRGSGGKLIEYK